MAYKQQKCTFTVLEARSQRSGLQLVGSGPSFWSKTYRIFMWRKVRSPVGLFKMGTSLSSTRAPPSRSNHLPDALTPNTITLRVRDSQGGVEDINIQTIAWEHHLDLINEKTSHLASGTHSILGSSS